MSRRGGVELPTRGILKERSSSTRPMTQENFARRNKFMKSSNMDGASAKGGVFK